MVSIKYLVGRMNCTLQTPLGPTMSHIDLWKSTKALKLTADARCKEERVTGETRSSKPWLCRTGSFCTPNGHCLGSANGNASRYGNMGKVGPPLLQMTSAVYFLEARLVHCCRDWCHQELQDR